MTIRAYNYYKDIPISRDYDVVDGEQVYIGNGQECHTLWFKSVPEAKKFIDRYRGRMDITEGLLGLGLIPRKICQGCKGHYSFKSAEWQKATRDNCEDYKQELKRVVSKQAGIQ